MSKYPPPTHDEISSIIKSIQQEMESPFSYTGGPHISGWPTLTSSTTTQTPPPTTLTSPSQTYATPYQTETNTAQPDFQDSKDFWDKLAAGTKAGIIVAACIVILAVVVASVWFCCGCCGLRHRNQRRKEIIHPTLDTDTVPLQTRQITTETRQAPMVTRHLTPMSRMASTISRASRGGEAPPPLYAEVTPPQHTTIAGGITHVREEEEGIISDGKMPLSEIPFEDVILDHSSSASSARNFDGRHMGLGGDTTGHTNS